MSTFTIFLVLIMIVSLLLMLVIMVQNPKGGGLSSTLGGGASQVVGGVKKTGDFLDKSTWTLASILILLILLSNVALKSNFGSAADSKLLNGNAPTEVQETLPAEIPAAAPAEVPASTDEQ